MVPHSVRAHVKEDALVTTYLEAATIKPVRPLADHETQSPPLAWTKRPENFWRHVDRSPGEGECWPWTGYLTNKGYGRLLRRVDGKPKRFFAHVVAFGLSHGYVPVGRFILHRCNNPPCCNPAHLYPGTIKENHDDMDRAGRRVDNSGERNGQHRLTERDVVEIKRLISMRVSRRSIASRFGVSQNTIDLIAWGRRWRHVGGDS